MMRLLPTLLVLIMLSGCGEDPEDLPGLRFEVYSMQAPESSGLVDATLILGETATQDIQIEIESTAGEANEDDFVLSSSSVVLSSGSKEVTFQVEIIDDDISESWKEDFTLTIANAEGATVTGSPLVVTILDNEPPATGYDAPTSYDGYELAWSDEFDELNANHWTFEIGNGCPDLCGWGNDELQSYTDENHSIVDGKLLIEARKINGAYTSTRMITKGKVSFEYGRLDIRASMPYGQGLWPAIWLLGDNIDEVGWPKCGEIDIMEMVGGKDDQNVSREGTTHGTVHWDNAGSYANYGGHTTLSNNELLAEEFHVYSITWDVKEIIWYLDGEQYHVIDITPGELSEFHDSFFMILNTAVGGRWPGNPDENSFFPQRMYVDYVRYFEPAS